MEIRQLKKCTKCFHAYFTDEIHTCSLYRRKKELTQIEGAIEVIQELCKDNDPQTIAKNLKIPLKEILYLIRMGKLKK